MRKAVSMPVRRRRRPGSFAPSYDSREGGTSRYLRQRDLPRLLPLLASECRATSLAEHERLVAMLRRALRAERLRGVAGEWSYDLGRHARLLEAYRIEREALRSHRARRGVRLSWTG